MFPDVGGIFVVATRSVSPAGTLPVTNSNNEGSSGRRKPHGITINIQADSDSLGKDNILFMGRMQAFSAGVMVYLSVIDIIPESAREIGIALALIWLAIGVVCMCLLEAILEPYTQGGESEKNDQQKMLHTSMVTFVGMALHNTLEGLSVYLSALKDIKFGLPLSIVIMLHNMAEGVAVAIPIYLATRNRAKVIQLTFFNGLFEPIGVIVAGFLLQSVLTDILLAKLLASVAGVMLFISVHELIPMALKYAGTRQTAMSAVAGTAICLVVLMIVDAVT
jgi:ZIP family zinc transporter